MHYFHLFNWKLSYLALSDWFYCSVGHLFCWMVKADESLPRPHHVAWQSPSSNHFSILPKPSLLSLPAYLNSSTSILPAVSTFHGLAAPSIPSLKSMLKNEVQGFLQYCNADTSLKETHFGGALQNANPSLQKRLLIFDRSDNKTRLFFYCLSLIIFGLRRCCP